MTLVIKKINVVLDSFKYSQDKDLFIVNKYTQIY